MGLYAQCRHTIVKNTNGVGTLMCVYSQEKKRHKGDKKMKNVKLNKDYLFTEIARIYDLVYDSGSYENKDEILEKLANLQSYCRSDDSNENYEEKLLNVYNDYIEGEFNERRNTKLDSILGLLYTTDDDGNEIEFYYDTDSKVFYGIRNDEIVYERKADFEEAYRIIEANDFDCYYDAITSGDELL